MWDQLTPGDIQNAKTELTGRREEMLARHAEELKGLDTDQAQLDTLAEAIELFARSSSCRRKPRPRMPPSSRSRKSASCGCKAALEPLPGHRRGTQL